MDCFEIFRVYLYILQEYTMKFFKYNRQLDHFVSYTRLTMALKQKVQNNCTDTGLLREWKRKKFRYTRRYSTYNYLQSKKKIQKLAKKRRFRKTKLHFTPNFGRVWFAKMQILIRSKNR